MASSSGHSWFKPSPLQNNPSHKNNSVHKAPNIMNILANK